MIGRGALGNPWCFLPDNYSPSWNERIHTMSQHMNMMKDSK